ncbi:hypothetical protein LC146_27530 [Vibrio harveyi]|uniref:hypothetical protein n=1 Tax=Vibrio harveyi TaxID=669 RepID=UPI003BB5BFEC
MSSLRTWWRSLNAKQVQAAKKNTAKDDGSSVNGGSSTVSDVVALGAEYSGALYYFLCAHVLEDRYCSTPMEVDVKDIRLEPKKGEFECNKALDAIETHGAGLNLTWLDEDPTA